MSPTRDELLAIARAGAARINVCPRCGAPVSPKAYGHDCRDDDLYEDDKREQDTTIEDALNDYDD